MFQPDRPAPTDSVGRLADWCLRQFIKISEALYTPSGNVTFTVLYAEPSKVRAGMVVYADGTTWNPGSGQGLYRRNVANSAWVFLG